MTASDVVPTHVSVSFPNRTLGEITLVIDNTRDRLLTPFGLATIRDRYLLPGETAQTMFGRVAGWYAKDQAHGQRVYDAMSQLWFMPATPVLSNGGTDRGLPISCFLNAVPDSLDGIQGAWNENVALASSGGGIGTYWGDVREKGAGIRGRGTSSGIVPFIKVMDSLTLAISQGSLRRGSAAVYLDVHHPEIEEFVEVRRQTGDPNRRSLNIHHGIMISDAFMDAVRANGPFDLISPATGKTVKTVRARDLFIRMVTARLETGEPYMVFSDTVNRKLQPVYKALGLKVKQSNLCSEIALHTGIDYQNKVRTAVCCLSSLNIETWDQWKGQARQLIKDALYFLDEVIEDFIVNTKGKAGFENANYSAHMERSIGLGVMGFHSYLQQHGVAFGSDEADQINRKFFYEFSVMGDVINVEAARELGMNPDSVNAGLMGRSIDPVRWSNWSSIAPTASISIIAGNASPCTEPWPGNSFLQKTLSGSFSVRNRYLVPIIRTEAEARFPPINDAGPEDYDRREQWIEDQWSSITENLGSVQHLEYLTQREKEVFATAFEVDQMAIIRQAADRAPFITQMASVNISLPGDVSKGELVKLHLKAHELGLPSLYYCRSLSVARAMNVAGEMPQPRPPHDVVLKDRGERADVMPEDCEACQ
jgi:ribonucleoside-diphosphate reductase alpha chain